MTEVVVVGSGIAGITAALHAASTGATVTLVTKGALADANTTWAQGGIAAATTPDDSPGAHARDTIAAGAGLADPRAVAVLTREGPDRIRDLVDAGVAFDRDGAGAFARGLEAAHSRPRVLHAGGDATGRAIEQALIARLRDRAVRVIEDAFLVDLVVVPATDGPAHVTGVDVRESGIRRVLPADAVILATGGAGQLFARTTNPPVATGDGIAAALRAGADTAGLEFVQFHPTVLAGGFLVSEAVRGEGAVIVDETGRRFLPDVHPDGELAPRDVVARAIAHRMRAQDDRPVLLDATAGGPAARAAFLRGRFPTIDAAMRVRGLDWAREPVPVTPAAHYLMGGVATDLRGRTSVAGVYAVGEVACTGVHGGNRLASNSLLEGAVFGARAGDAVVADAARGAWPVARRRVAPTAVAPAVDAPEFSRAALQRLMWECAGVIRDAAGLARAAGTLAAWAARAGTAVTIAQHEDANLLQVAAAVVAAASARGRSVGAHFRADDPADGSEARLLHAVGSGAARHRPHTRPVREEAS